MAVSGLTTILAAGTLLSARSLILTYTRTAPTPSSNMFSKALCTSVNATDPLLYCQSCTFCCSVSQCVGFSRSDGAFDT